jgi:hypothetical protein
MADYYDEGPERPSSGFPWTLVIVIAVVAVLGVPIIAAIAIPSLLAARRGALETNAIGSMRAYASAQTMYHRKDWDNDGMYEYATPFTKLCTQTDADGNPVMLLDASFAGAQGRSGTPRHGYVFQDMKTMGGSPIDWCNDYALCGIPSVYGRTGYRTFIVCTNGTVFSQDQGRGSGFVADYPSNPQAAGWIIAE